MDSAASRIIKAKQYAAERDTRIQMHSFDVELHGDNANHFVSYKNGDWNCDCEEFQLRGVCSHVMAMEEILGDSIEPAVYVSAAQN